MIKVFYVLFLILKLSNCLYQNTGIVTIATGGYNANDLVKSLRKNGNWDRNIYIYSDPCTPQVNNTIALKIPKITTSQLESKIHKTSILKNTTEKYILFLDSDIKINRPLDIFFKKIKKYNNNCDAYMPHDMWYSKKFIFNAGIILVKRNKSEYFLNKWKNIILSDNYKGNKDQPALKFLIDNNIIKMCLIPDKLVYYKTDTLNKLRESTSSVFTHYLKLKSNFKKCDR